MIRCFSNYDMASPLKNPEGFFSEKLQIKQLYLDINQQQKIMIADWDRCHKAAIYFRIFPVTREKIYWALYSAETLLADNFKQAGSTYIRKLCPMPENSTRKFFLFEVFINVPFKPIKFPRTTSTRWPAIIPS